MRVNTTLVVFFENIKWTTYFDERCSSFAIPLAIKNN